METSLRLRPRKPDTANKRPVCETLYLKHEFRWHQISGFMARRVNRKRHYPVKAPFAGFMMMLAITAATGLRVGEIRRLITDEPECAPPYAGKNSLVRGMVNARLKRRRRIVMIPRFESTWL